MFLRETHLGEKATQDAPQSLKAVKEGVALPCQVAGPGVGSDREWPDCPSGGSAEDFWGTHCRHVTRRSWKKLCQ